MRALISLFAVILIPAGIFCQTADSTKTIAKRGKVYHVNYFVTGSIIGIGMAGDFFAISRLKNKLVVSDEELLPKNLDLQINLMNSIDRWSLHQNPADRGLYKKISDYGEIGIFLLPSLLIIDKNMRRDWLDLLLIYVEGHTVTFSIYNYSPFGPTFTNRYRPVVYYTDLAHDVRVNNNSRNSFFSGHVGSCTYSTFFMVKAYCDYHPNIGAVKYLLYLAASVPPLAIGYARIKSLDHFPSDVAVGFVLGAVIGIVVHALHKVPCSRYLALGLNTAPDEVGVSVKWKLGTGHQLALKK